MTAPTLFPNVTAFRQRLEANAGSAINIAKVEQLQPEGRTISKSVALRAHGIWAGLANGPQWHRV